MDCSICWMGERSMMRPPCFQMNPFSVPWASSVEIWPSLHSIRSMPYFLWYRMQSTSWSMLWEFFLSSNFSRGFIQMSHSSFRQAAVSKRAFSERELELAEILLRMVDIWGSFLRLFRSNIH